MEVQLISQVIVKPSSPTPSHLKIFKLSLLDQLIPAPYAPIVLFYPNYNGASYPQILKRVEKLEQSLSKTLASFYPLAGTIQDDLSIECNDKGAYFATTKVDCHLFQFLSKPDLQLICKFLPCDVGSVGPMAGTRVTNIQVNVFECGGIAIGLCISHRILDGAALKSFLKSWAATATGAEENAGPNFIASSLFPATDFWLKDSALAMWGASFKVGRSVTKRFVFDAASIASLRAMATSSGARCLTRVEAISAFLWKCSMAASEANSGYRKSSMLTHVVNLRPRAAPTLSEHSIGNLIWISGARCLVNQDKGMPALADQIQYSISKINSDYVKKMHGNEGPALMRKSLKEIGDFGSKEAAVDYLGFSSWCGFGFYEIDFGWGKPIWVSSFAVNAPVFMNLIILMETRLGDGIEAWVTLDQQEMDIMEHDQELMAFISVDPSPL
nr:vinorine synthase-like [Coffea arabica]